MDGGISFELLHFVYASGVRLIEKCEVAKQCETEVVRIALRTQNVLGTLESSSSEFVDNMEIRSSLLELKDLLETLHALVERCKFPVTLSGRAALLLQRKNPNQEALIRAEQKLEHVTKDLGLPMLTDIKRQLNRMHHEAQERAQLAASNQIDTQALAEVIRTEIRRAMDVRNEQGSSIREKIQSEVAYLVQDGEDPVRRFSLFNSAPGEEAYRGEGPRSRGGGLVVRLGRVRFDELEEGEMLGEGTFGVVLSGTYRGRDVAIKKARGALGSSSVMEDFRREAEIHYSMRHPNIVEVIAFGLGESQRPPCLVMERMHETLYDLLGVEEMELPVLDALCMLRDVCQGLSFLHQHGIIHRDLKSLNILLDQGWTAKICDFGLAKVTSSVASSTGRVFHSKAGSEFWMAPEVHSNRKATKASDVFSLHVVMWEVLTKQRAGMGRPIGELVLANPDASLPLDDLECIEEVQVPLMALVWECGAAEASRRPSLKEICPQVEALVEATRDPFANAGLIPALKERRSAQAPPEDRVASAASTASTASTAECSSRGSTTSTWPPPMPSNSPASNQMGGAFHSHGGSGRAPPPLPHRPASVGTHPRVVPSNRGPAHPPLPQRPQGLYATATAPPADRGAPPPFVPAAFQDSPAPGPPSGRHQWKPHPPPPRSHANKPKKNSTTKGLIFEDQAALDYFFEVCGRDASGGIGWACSDGWGLPVPVGTWYGVHTSYRATQGGERVVDLLLSGNNLRGPLPEELANLDALLNLDLSKNGVAGPIPPSLGNLRALATLNLSETMIVGPIPPELGKLKALKKLEMHHTWLSGSIPDSLGNLSWALERLDLSDCKLEGFIPRALGRLRGLRVLRLRSNALAGPIPAELAELPNLEELNLHGNRLVGYVVVGRQAWTRLETLDLSANFLQGGIPHDVFQLPSLRVLNLAHNGLTGGIPPALAHAGSLEELDLSYTPLGGVVPTCWRSLPRLTKLILGSCSLVGFIPSELGALHNLKHLCLSNNDIQGLIPGELIQLRQIQVLNLERNCLQVTEATYTGIKTVLPPGCDVSL